MNSYEQIVLWEPSPEEEEALTFSQTELTKRYTAEQVAKIEWKREAILMLLGAGWPISRIKSRLHVNQDTVVALAKQSAEEVGEFTQEFAEHLIRLAAGWFGIAASKAADASFKDLMLGADIATKHARELKLMGLSREKESPAIEEDHVAAAAELRQLMAAELAAELARAGAAEAGSDPKAEPANAAERPATPQPVVNCGGPCGIEPGPIPQDDGKTNKTKDS